MAEKSFKVVYDRNACIGAAACAAVAPEIWKMAPDGKADLVGHELDENGKQFVVVKESEMNDDFRKSLDLNKEAAEVCPVQAIHVYELNEDGSVGKKLV